MIGNDPLKLMLAISNLNNNLKMRELMLESYKKEVELMSQQQGYKLYKLFLNTPPQKGENDE